MKYLTTLFLVATFNHFGFTQFSMNINKIAVAVTCEEKIPLGIISYKYGEEVEYEALELSYENFHSDSLLGSNYKLNDLLSLATIETMMEYQENVVCLDTTMLKAHLMEFKDYTLLLYYTRTDKYNEEKIYDTEKKYGLHLIDVPSNSMDTTTKRENELSRIVLEWRNGKDWEEKFWKEVSK